MRFKIGDYVKVVNLHSGGNFCNGDIVRICQIRNDGENSLYGAVSLYDNCVWYLHKDEIESLESVATYKINRLCDAIIKYCDAIIKYIESVSNYGVEEDWLVSELKGIKEYDR